MISNRWFDEAFVRDWTNGPLLVRTDTMRFLRAGDLAVSPSGAQSDDLVAWDAQTGELIAYSTVHRNYARVAKPALEKSGELLSREGRPLLCRTVFDAYRALCEPYTLERVEELAWVPKLQTREAARLLFESGPVCYYSWSGISQHTNATQTDRAIAILMALTGSFDVPGGNVEFGRPPANQVTGGELLSAEQRAKCIGLTRSPLGPGKYGWISSGEMYDAILQADPYLIRGLVGFGRNFVVNHADTERGVKALSKLEFFAHADVVMTPTASFADIFLPINTPWERDALRIGFEGSQAAENLVQLRQAAVPALGESRSDAFVVFELAKRLGLGDLFWNGDVDAGLEHMLAPLGFDLAELRANPQGIRYNGTTRYRRYLTEGFKTPTGKLEIFSEAFRDAGAEPLPSFVEPAMSPYRAGNEEYPLILTSAKIVHFCHGQHRHVPSLRRRARDPEVTMHPDSAAERGIADGDWVELRSPHGQIRMRARLDSNLDQRVVWAQYGWWQDNKMLGLPGFDAFSAAGANYNRLISDEEVDPVSGATGLRSNLCEVRPISTKLAWPGWREFRIAVTKVEAAGVLSLRLEPVDGLALPDFRGGQHVPVQIPGPAGEPMVRCYSLSSSAAEGSYRIAVKLIRHRSGRYGRVSGILHNAKVGSRLKLRAPRGDFHAPSEPPAERAPITLVAGGIGITPILGILNELRDVKWSGPIRLFYGVRSGRDHAFSGEIDALREHLPRFAVTTFFSRPSTEDRSNPVFDVEGRIAACHLLSDEGALASYYLCGPCAMVSDLADALSHAGVPKARLRREAFAPPARGASAGHQGPQPVRLSRSGVTLNWAPETGTLLDLLDKSGISPASGCRTGQCETCALLLIDGVVSHPEGTVPVEAGRCLPCVGVPVSPIVLDI
ncbi:MAG: molybdopterin-dependent oxidoreductase [Burkholderiaceae bacterium]|nr:molybdopterin-dependent oxidoreductase [Burkholderiaceae bacterium]